jgi:hypothetical protein
VLTSTLDGGDSAYVIGPVREKELKRGNRNRFTVATRGVQKSRFHQIQYPLDDTSYSTPEDYKLSFRPFTLPYL